MTNDINSMGWLDRARLGTGLLRDHRVPTWTKVIVPLAAALYVASPVDLIPDFILGLGQVDDLGVVAVAALAMLALMTRLAPKHVVDEHLQRMGRTEGAPATATVRAEDHQRWTDVPFRVIDE